MKRKLISVAAMLAVMLLMPLPALALEPGVYTGYMETSYYNPDTGAIDDGGTKNAELGVGMCRSATDEACLVEVDAKGKMWVTARLLLQSNCGGVKLATRTGYNTYSNANLTITAENSGNDSVDYRFPVNDPEGWLKGSMYVTPMGRDVLWYLRVKPGTLTPGSGDFQVHIDLNEIEANKAAKNNSNSGNGSSNNTNSASGGGNSSGNNRGSGSPNVIQSGGSSSGGTVNSPAAGTSGGSGVPAPSANTDSGVTGGNEETPVVDPGTGETVPAAEEAVPEAPAEELPAEATAPETGAPEETAAAEAGVVPVDENHDGIISEEEKEHAVEAAAEQAGDPQHKNLLLDEDDGNVEADLSTIWIVLGSLLGIFLVIGVIAWFTRDKWFYLVEDWKIFGGNGKNGGGRGKR